MKTLLILRHAKSSWGDPELPDHNRPLNKRGRRDAPRMGQLIAEQDLVPDAVVTSSARRARKTADKVVKNCGFDGKVVRSDELYMADPAACIRVLNGVDDAAQRVMIVGHNPTFEELLACLCGEHHALPTAALAVVELPIDRWSELTLQTSGKLQKVWLPRELE